MSVTGVVGRLQYLRV